MPEQDPRPQWKRTLGEMLSDTVQAIKGAVIGESDEVGPSPQNIGALLAASFPLLGAVKRVAKPIRAYHGSPHDFDQFSLGKIGTGEGAQAYGHGLYFAESPEVARQYRDQLVDMRVSAAKRALAESGGDIDAAIARTRAEIDRLMALPNAGGDVSRRNGLVSVQEEKLSELNALKQSGAMSQGRMYEVDIHADPDDFLDWDAPLSQQSEKVRRGMDSAAANRGVELRGDWGELDAGIAYDRMSKSNDPSRRLDASEALKAAGIPGIKYYDAMSRNTNKDWVVTSGSGMARAFATEAEARAAMPKIPGATLTPPSATRNYVVFDDKLISIVKKYGVAGALTAGLINEAQARALNQKGFQ